MRYDGKVDKSPFLCKSFDALVDLSRLLSGGKEPI
jgi:hypothetical protein